MMWARIGVAAVLLAACSAPARVPFGQATGERVSSVVTRVPDTQAHDVEVAEYVLRSTPASADGSPLLRMVLIADHGEWQQNVFGYAEQESPAGRRHFYRVFGRLYRDTLAARPTAKFQLTATYVRSVGSDWQRPRGLGYHVVFHMDVDEQTGRVVAGSPHIQAAANP